MKIVIKTLKRDQEFHRFILYLPTSLIKAKYIWKKLIKNEFIKSEQIIEVKKIYKELRKYVKANGHFNLIEVSDNKTYVLIRV